MPRPTRVLSTLVGIVAMLGTLLVAGTPAQAAVPNRFGFVLWNGAAVVPGGTYPAATTVVPLAVGRYQVTFPGQGITGGVVHVTAITNGPRWCQAEAWGPSGVNEIAIIRCYRVGGVPDNSGFSAIFTNSSGPGAPGPYGYVDTQPTGTIISQYNAAGAPNVVTPLGVGQWSVKFLNIGSGGPVDGSAQVTAVATVGTRCKIRNWTSTAAQQEVIVFCFNAAGALANSRFTVSYQQKASLYGAGFPPQYFGYLWNAPPVGPAFTNFNSVLGYSANTLISAGPGLSLVTFRQIGFAPLTVQVTAAGSNSNFCGLNFPWTIAGVDLYVRDVSCYTNAGAAVNTGFTISASSRL
ncbi:hypothetical protein Cme02nite_08960 [Catellatospora methionotrophica]|uniref:Uncharacterized protein n=1 Tax=Catellatospora methionotrophica TaxID=121620 RepID=A0A8J3LBE9_9ACTN|nr:hypothetical protein [Catellatospora methionotrophica]GIG12564.1 hypothetical protein Cme02nite_08960 [Catellatospora methionotrophica]